METDHKHLIPETVLMNCIADAERIDKIVVITHTKDGFYEHWSNGLETYERLGLIEVTRERIRKEVREFTSEKEQMPVNKVFKTRMRMERAIRYESLGWSDADISLAIGITPAGFAQMKMQDTYKQLRIQLASGIISQIDEGIGEETEELRSRLRENVPLAMQALVDAVVQKQDPKLRVQAATELLDRDGRFMKASRTIVNASDELPTYMSGKDDEQVARILAAQMQQPKTVGITLQGDIGKKETIQ